MHEYLVVKCQIEGNPEAGFDICRYPEGRHPTLSEAKRWGLREWDHDDFNIAIVDGDRLIDWTWMGESIGEPPDTLAEIATSIGLRAASHIGGPTLVDAVNDGTLKAEIDAAVGYDPDLMVDEEAGGSAVDFGGPS